MSRLSIARASLAGGLAVLLLAAPASAAQIKPRGLVLQQADVPAHYVLDKDNTMAFSYAQFAGRPDAPKIIESSGFVAGYFAKYRNTDPPRWRDISSASYLFRQPLGATRYLMWMRHALEHQHGPTFSRSRIDVGAEAWAYTARSRDAGSLVLWRTGRVVALVACQEMSGHRSLALSLARKQQRRIAEALR
jgi:hypothetical protein